MYVDSYAEAKTNLTEIETETKNLSSLGKVGISMSSLIERIKKQTADQTVLESPVVPGMPTVQPAVQAVTQPVSQPVSQAVGGLQGILSAMKAKENQPAPAVVQPVVTQPAVVQPTIVQPAVVAPAVIQSAPVAAEALATALGAPVSSQPIAPATAEPAVQQRAPWYMPDPSGKPCAACGTSEIQGYNSKGEPCRICDIRAKAAGVPTSDNYIVDILDNGVLQFTPKPNGSGVAPMATTMTMVKPVETKVQTVLPVAPDVMPEQTVAPETASAPKIRVRVGGKEVEYVPGDLAKGIGQEKTAEKAAGTGFTLLIGCNYVTGNSVVLADDILKASLEHISEVAGKSIAELDHFTVNKALEAYIPEVAEMLSGQTVVAFAPTKGSALAVLIDGLRQYANTIIVPMGL